LHDLKSGARGEKLAAGEYAGFGRRSAAGGPRSGSVEQAERLQRLDNLEAALKQLGDRCRELFRLKLEGYSFHEIQKRLKVESLNTLYTWDFRCRKQLAEKLNG
jgi:RNA polymerase sigma-70 factor (ECF subfamily)